jgi:hypothetical protein
MSPSLASSIDPALARGYFDEAKALSAKDAGRLWGVELYGPMLFADPVSRAVVANQPDAEGRLRLGGLLIRRKPAIRLRSSQRLRLQGKGQ